MSRRRGRSVQGIVLIDKPSGISSNDALQKVKRIYHAAKAGHTGALDPLATGMLPICFGEATKFSQFLLDADKRYVVTAKLGQRTTTSDSDGEVILERPVQVTLTDLETHLASFRGDIQQVPSMYSALKYQGQPLYKYARQGIEVPRSPRDITVFDLQLLRFEGDEVELEVHCSKGTYIRTIVDDLGELLGCGAHVIQLRRSQVAHYPVDCMVTIESLQALLDQALEDEVAPKDRLDPLLLPTDTAVSGLKAVQLNAQQAHQFSLGQAIHTAEQGVEEIVRLIIDSNQEFIGIGQLNPCGRVDPKRLIQRVMQESTEIETR
tara:strand:- start:5459 stop:6421 length:963 start_codon:yes stop_codon:yes gene_type:complete